LAVLTVIVPTFKRPEHLRKSLESLKRQTFEDFVVCVYDNADQKEAHEVVREFSSHDSRFHYFAHPENIGCEKNFDFGLRRVKTPFFAFLSDDDLLLPDCFSLLMEVMQCHPEIAFVFGQTLRKDSSGRIFSSFGGKSSEQYYPPKTIACDLLGMRFPCWTGGIFRSAIKEVVGFIDTESFLIDLDYLLRINNEYACVVLNKPCSIFLHNKKGASFLPPGDRFFASYGLLLKKIERGEISGEGLQKGLLKHIGKTCLNKLILALEEQRLDVIAGYRRAASAFPLPKAFYPEFLLFRAIGWLSLSLPALGRLFGYPLRLRRRLKQRGSIVGAK